MSKETKKDTRYPTTKYKLACNSIDGYVSLYRFGKIILGIMIPPIVIPMLGPIANFSARFNTSHPV